MWVILLTSDKIFLFPFLFCSNAWFKMFFAHISCLSKFFIWILCSVFFNITFVFFSFKCDFSSVLFSNGLSPCNLFRWFSVCFSLALYSSLSLTSCRIYYTLSRKKIFFKQNFYRIKLASQNIEVNKCEMLLATIDLLFHSHFLRNPQVPAGFSYTFRSIGILNSEEIIECAIKTLSPYKEPGSFDFILMPFQISLKLTTC